MKNIDEVQRAKWNKHVKENQELERMVKKLIENRHRCLSDQYYLSSGILKSGMSIHLKEISK